METIARPILIVDDDIDLAESLDDILTPAGYQVELAHTAADALTVCRHFKPQVALLDIRLGGGETGIDLMPKLKQIHPELLCIFTTAFADVETTVSALKQGAYDYLRKPLYPQELSATLARCFDKIELERNNKRNLEALHASENRYRAMFENALEGIFRSSETHFITANPAMLAMLDYDSVAELTASNLLQDIFTSPDEYADYVAQHRRRDVVRNREFYWHTRDGREIIVNLSSQVINRSVDGELLLEGMVQDITERKMLAAQLRQSQKMEAFGQMAGGIAHDFNNILTAIIGYSDVLLRKMNRDNQFYKSIYEINRAGIRAASLTKRLLSFSRNQLVQAKRVNLNQIVEEMSRMLRRLIQANITLTVLADPYLQAIMADPNEVEQVLLNMVLNARDALPGGGDVTIKTANVQVKPDHYACKYLSKSPGDYVLLSVTDNGVGMSPETLERIFDPFFTTKPQGVGTGLGLATVHGVVNRVAGFVLVHSELTKGSTFEAYFPAIPTATKPDTKPLDEIPVAKGGETVLLVEDEAVVRDLAFSILASFEYNVLSAANGQEAIQLAKSHQGTIDLLLTDIIMPGNMTGVQVAAMVQPLHPAMKVLYMSGYAEDVIAKQGVIPEDIDLLQKPFTLDGLLNKVHQVLSR